MIPSDTKCALCFQLIEPRSGYSYKIDPNTLRKLFYHTQCYHRFQILLSEGYEDEIARQVLLTH